MNNIQELRKIIADAPEGCTHHATKSNKYFMIDGWRMHVWLGEVWSVPISNELDVLIVGDVRPLSDLRTMVEQYEEIQAYKAKVAELELDVISRDLLLQSQEDKIAELEKENNMLKRVEKIFNDSPDLTFNVVEKLFKDELAIRDLEQQAKGVQRLVDNWFDINILDSEDIDVVSAVRFINELREQAAKLKEQANEN